MKVKLYKRHGSNCPFRKPGDKQVKDRAHRCQCSVWLEYRFNGVQKRQTTKQASWSFAEEKAHAIEKTHEDAELGRGPAPAEAKSVEQAIALFMDSKHGEDLAENTLYKHTLTLNRLQSFCDTTEEKS